jgi:hypothetical protein
MMRGAASGHAAALPTTAVCAASLPILTSAQSESKRSVDGGPSNVGNGSIASIAEAGLGLVMGRVISDIPGPKPRGHMIEHLADSLADHMQFAPAAGAPSMLRDGADAPTARAV